LLINRIITAVVLGIAVTGTILYCSTGVAAVVFGIVWLAGAWEWGRLAGLSGPFQLGYAGLVLASMVLVWWAGIGSLLATGVLWLAVAVWAVALAGVMTYPRRLAPPLIMGLGVGVLVAAWIAALRLHGSNAAGPGIALAALAIVWGADVGAYFVGRRFGRVKLAPRVSPGKTWEGVAGGMLLALAAGAAAAYWLGLSPGVLLLTTAVIAAVSIVGDLSVSMLKRNVGLKDCSGLLPGHGGMMDRIDGLTAALPFFTLALQLAGLLD
jgi:phosphatidate cytidylyltransferase